MLKRITGIFLAVVLMITVFAGCASKADYGQATEAAPRASSAQSANKISATFSESIAKDEAAGAEMDVASPAESPAAEPTAAEGFEAADSLAGSGASAVDVSNAILNERKIIRSANLTIEVENFDSAFNNIESIILGIGIVQETNINTERVYVEDELKLVKSGTIVLRVDKSKFDSVIGKLKGIGDVFNYTTNGQDVTDQYVDVESRLRLLRMEQSKLEAYLAKLDDLDKIFKTESRLTDIRFEIESLTGNLNKLNSLVELSTITITMNEKRPGYDPKPLTYGDRLLNSIKDSLLEVVEFLGDLLIFLVAAIPVLLLIGLFVLIGFSIYRRISRKRKETTTAVKTISDDNKTE